MLLSNYHNKGDVYSRDSDFKVADAESIAMYHCDAPISFPENCSNLPEFPEGLVGLVATRCHNMPKFPNSLRYISVTLCYGLPDFPVGAEEITVGNLSEMPEFPVGLKKLRVSFCSNVPKIPPKLLHFETQHTGLLDQVIVVRAAPRCCIIL
jgi:hypothetical protein